MAGVLKTLQTQLISVQIEETTLQARLRELSQERRRVEIAIEGARCVDAHAQIERTFGGAPSMKTLCTLSKALTTIRDKISIDDVYIQKFGTFKKQWKLLVYNADADNGGSAAGSWLACVLPNSCRREEMATAIFESNIDQGLLTKLNKFEAQKTTGWDPSPKSNATILKDKWLYLEI